ncbi:MAG: hypothetical protein OFPII_22250 [Osedax symbiont Rs1]|nr:MAG: hypothetical protein OFPII_22250 [Osedax symbiont Rs1]
MLTSQQLSRSAVQTSDALNLAANLSNKMRLNSAEANEPQSEYLTKINSSTIISTDCFGHIKCQQRSQALHDLLQWQIQLTQVLPNFQAEVCRDSSPGNSYLVKSSSCDNDQESPMVIKIWWMNAHRSADLALFYALEHSH